MSHVLKCFLKRKSTHLLVQNCLKTRNLLLFMKRDQHHKKMTPCFFRRRKDLMFFMIQWQICCRQQWRSLLQYSVMKEIMVNYVFGGLVTGICFWPEDMIRRINQGGIYLIGYNGRHITHDCTYCISTQVAVIMIWNHRILMDCCHWNKFCKFLF